MYYTLHVAKDHLDGQTYIRKNTNNVAKYETKIADVFTFSVL